MLYGYFEGTEMSTDFSCYKSWIFDFKALSKAVTTDILKSK